MGARIVIRVDGSHQVGMGHVYRMVNLAEILTEAGVESLTFCGRADEQVGTWLQKSKFKVEILPYDGEVIAPLTACLHARGANLLINDILDTDVEYMAAVRPVDCAIVNFDDRGPGRHLADCRINALPSKILPQEQGNHIYQGPDYLLLGGEFSPTTARRIRGESLTSLLITLGGSDTYGNTLAVNRCHRHILLPVRPLGITTNCTPCWRVINALQCMHQCPVWPNVCNNTIWPLSAVE